MFFTGFSAYTLHIYENQNMITFCERDTHVHVDAQTDVNNILSCLVKCVINPASQSICLTQWQWLRENPLEMFSYHDRPGCRDGLFYPLSDYNTDGQPTERTVRLCNHPNKKHRACGSSRFCGSHLKLKSFSLSHSSQLFSNLIN